MRTGFHALGRATAIALPLVLATAALAQRVQLEPVRDVTRVASEAAVGGLTPEQILERQAELHRWAIAQVPKGTSETGITVALTDRDQEDLAVPYVPGSMTPMRVGVVKEITERVGFARGQALGARGQKMSVGKLEPVEGGGFIWATTVSSPDALAMRIHFEDFSLPPTASVYVLNDEGEAYGPYTGTGLDATGEFWSHSIRSEKATVLLVVEQTDAAALRGMSFRITGVAHVAIDFPDVQADGSIASFCTYNATCVENNACTSSPAVNDAEGAVAKMRWIAGIYVYICSGGLIADTDPGTQIPYFMTANHCMSRNKDAKNLETFFLYTASCGTTNCPSSFGQPFTPPSTVGATVVATGNTGDFTLLQLNDAPPAGTTFLGWDNTPIAFTSGAALHRVSHPSGAPQAYSQHSVDTAIGTCLNTARGPWIYSSDVVGATEGGSSGSPVVNASGAFVGQLTGCCPVGGGNCDDVCNANNHTIDGALAYYWDSVAPYLAPAGSGCTSDPECDDGDACNGSETCNLGSGICESGTPVNCDDGDPCTADTCNPANGTCSNDPVSPCCGDLVCDAGEDVCSCPADCGSPPGSETSCNDGVDNDCDGDIDCADADCAGTPECPGATLAIVDCITYNANVTIDVAIVDNTGSPVSGASVGVEVFVNGSSIGTASGTTDGTGVTGFRLRGTSNGDCIETSITNVSAAGLAWDGTAPSNGYQKAVDTKPDADCRNCSDACGDNSCGQ